MLASSTGGVGVGGGAVVVVVLFITAAMLLPATGARAKTMGRAKADTIIPKRAKYVRVNVFFCNMTILQDTYKAEQNERGEFNYQIINRSKLVLRLRRQKKLNADPEPN